MKASIMEHNFVEKKKCKFDIYNAEKLHGIKKKN